MWFTSTTWLDARGYIRISLARTTGGIGAILPAWQALSQAGQQQCWESPVSNISTAPIASEYESGNIVALMTYVSSAGTLVNVPIYAPKLAIFKADGYTVDGGNTDVQTFNTAVIASMVDPAGFPVVAWIGGSLAPSR